ncbi:excinuclease ABC subunit C [candidate division SR1 bacterium RAAC1_SR1_1]|nr:excinuclease ABC subunit C [candidate division SR1 bacterium RAAC1_SR1_1]
MENIALNNIPQEPGVYFFKDKKDIVLYIGKAKNLQKRVAQYFAAGSVWKQDMMQKAEKVDFIVVQNESEALYLEDNLIKQHLPEYNNLLKADNSYTYLKITKHEYPEIYLTRKKIPDGSTYIGPKHNTQELKKLLQYLRQILQRRGCKNIQFKQKKLCSDYYFGLCKGRCALADLGSYQPITAAIASFFKGNTKPIEQEIRQKMKNAIDQQHFERAGKLRDILLSLQAFTEQQTAVIASPITGHILEIREIGERRVYVVLYLYQGKVIDVIRQKINKSDYDKESLLANLSATYNSFTPLDDHYVALTKKLKKAEAEEINKFLQRCFESFVVSTSFEKENLLNDLLSTLQTRYQFENFPYRMELLDISHLSGGRASGGISCLLGGIPYFKGYRRYKISSKVKQQDDYAALKEVLIRRFLSDKEATLPDIFILDGGKGQLHVIKELLEEEPAFQEIFDKVVFVGLGKGAARKTTNIGKQKFGEDITEKIYSFDASLKIKEIKIIYDDADKLLIKLRNEAHRFANAYRQKQMSKEWK